MITESERVATERKKIVEKYFAEDPTGLPAALVRLGGGLILLIIGFVTLGSVAAVGVIFILVALYLGLRGGIRLARYMKLYNEGRPKPTGRQMDDYLAKDLETIESRAMVELGLTADDLETGDQVWDPVAAFGITNRPPKRPILVWGPVSNSGFAVGDDNIWRFRSYEVMVICPTRHHLALFRTELSMLTGGLYHEETQEYQYSHVVSVSTVTVPAPSAITRTDTKDKDKDSVRFAKATLKQFELGVSSGRSSTVTVGISNADNPGDEARLPDSGIQQVIASVRRVLRDKKGAFG
jgi:hypothetical protein